MAGDLVKALGCLDGDPHKYEGRYDFKKAGRLVARTYLRDVCIKCGDTIERRPSALQLFEAGLIGQQEAKDYYTLMGGLAKYSEALMIFAIILTSILSVLLIVNIHLEVGP